MPLATDEFVFLRDLVALHSGNVIPRRHTAMLEQRLMPVAGNAGAVDVHSLIRQLRQSTDRSLSERVAQAATVNETRFFRDPGLFQTLQNTVLPEIIRRNRSRRQIRIWSAACSSGQEPYSVAMLINEHFPELSDWDVKIVASDLCEPMLQRVREGRYSRLEVDRGLTRPQLIRHFDRVGNCWQVNPDLQELIDVRQVNLVHRWPYIGHFDLALLRNVLVYFKSETRTDILKRLRGTLRPDGYLFIGASETLIGLRVPYQRKEIDATVCYRPSLL